MYGKNNLHKKRWNSGKEFSNIIDSGEDIIMIFNNISKICFQWLEFTQPT